MKPDDVQKQCTREIEINPIDDVIIRFRELNSGEAKDFSEIVGGVNKNEADAAAFDDKLEGLMEKTFIGSNIDDGPPWTEIASVLKNSGDIWLNVGKEFVEKNPLVQRALSQRAKSESSGK